MPGCLGSPGLEDFFFSVFIHFFLSPSSTHPALKSNSFLPTPILQGKTPGQGQGSPSHPPASSSAWNGTLAQLEFLALIGLFLWSCIFQTVSFSFFLLPSLCFSGGGQYALGRRAEVLLTSCCVTLGMSLHLSGCEKIGLLRLGFSKYGPLTVHMSSSGLVNNTNCWAPP